MKLPQLTRAQKRDSARLLEKYMYRVKGWIYPPAVPNSSIPKP